MDRACAHGFEAHALKKDTPWILGAIAELTAFLRKVQADVICTHGLQGQSGPAHCGKASGGSLRYHFHRPIGRLLSFPIHGMTLGKMGQTLYAVAHRPKPS